MVLSAEQHPPYDRPPLSKAILAGDIDDTALRFDADALAVDLRLGTTATGVDVDARRVLTAADDVPYDGLVIATGATPVRLPGPGERFAHTGRWTGSVWSTPGAR